MKLRGKCRLDFENWYIAKRKKSFSLNYVQMVVQVFGDWGYPHLKAFECSPPEMKYGVFVDFFESVKDITKHDPVEYEQSLITGGHDRQFARRSTIEKAWKRYNKNITNRK